MLELILSGGTGRDKEKKLNNLFLKLVGKGKILYIPMARETKDYSPCLDWIHSVLKKEVTMVTDLSKKISLSSFKGIYIGGGNTFKLLKEIKENKWESKLKNFKGIIFGGSAGAIIFGKNISTAAWGEIKDKNEVKLKDLSALNKIKGYNIKAHYLKKEEKDVRDFVKKTKTPIIALPEDAGILVKNNKITPINKVYIFKQKSI